MGHKNVAVSIITPAYKCKDTIFEAYQSIKNQTFKSWEWIIIEDNSSDQTFEYICELVEGDDRVFVLRTDKNSGAAIARNIGIEFASGRYISFLDADDFWEPTKLSEQIEFMRKNNHALTYTDYYVLIGKKTKIFSPKRLFIGYKGLIKHCDIGCSTVVYDSYLLKKKYMPLDCYKNEDYGMWLDITREGLIAYKINKCLATYRITKGSVSSNKMDMFKNHFNVYRKHEHFSFFKSLLLTVLYSFNKIFRKY